MKDIIENRFRLDTPSKLRLLGMSLRENGFLWTSLIGLYYAASAVGEKSFSAAAALRRKWNLPGMNSVSMNKFIWESWDWSGQGEEWSPSAAWKKSVIDTLLIPNVPAGSVIVEIGPGGGEMDGGVAAPRQEADRNRHFGSVRAGVPATLYRL